MRSIIFANGTLKRPEGVRSYLQPGDTIIAADGGAHHCQQLDLKPDYIIGDLDSLASDAVNRLAEQGSQVIRYSSRKDFTDLELALQFAAGLPSGEILVFGALGDRWDQTLTNLLLPAAPAFSKASIRLIDDNQEICLVSPERSLALNGQPGDTVSLIPVGGDACDITTQGLEYPLRQETLYFGASRGVSNVLLAEQAYITLEKGLLICTLIHHTNSTERNEP